MGNCRHGLVAFSALICALFWRNFAWFPALFSANFRTVLEHFRCGFDGFPPVFWQNFRKLSENLSGKVLDAWSRNVLVFPSFSSFLTPKRTLFVYFFLQFFLYFLQFFLHFFGKNSAFFWQFFCHFLQDFQRFLARFSALFGGFPARFRRVPSTHYPWRTEVPLFSRVTVMPGWRHYRPQKFPQFFWKNILLWFFKMCYWIFRVPNFI